MKRLKFLIIALGIFAVQGVFAVQLPKTSYSDYYTSSGSENISIYGSGSSITGSFSMLGDGETSEFSDCEGDEHGNPKLHPEWTCSQCCDNLVPIKSLEDLERRKACVTYCQAGPPLPLDAPLWFMLALAAVGAAFSVTLRKRLA